MAFAIYLKNRAFCADDPQIIDQHITPETMFSFVDFVPSVIERSTTACIKTAEVKYHSFSDLIELANQWLEAHLEWEAINCETTMLLYKYNDAGSYYELRPNDTTFYIYGSEKNNVLKALRLWIKRRDEAAAVDAPEFQTLQHIDYVPVVDASEYYDKFENLDDVVNRVNKDIKERKIEGRLLTIETLQCDADLNWKVDPNVSLSFFSSKTVFILRLFIERGIACEEEIGIADFVPQHLSGGGFFKRPKFESYTDVMERASHWLAENPELGFKNAQSIDVKLKSVTSMDTKTMAYTEHGDYLRIFLVAYTKLIISDVDDTNAPPPASSVFLASKVFLPTKKSDTVADLRTRLEEWVSEVTQEVTQMEASMENTADLHQPRLLSAETVEVFCKSEMSDELTKIVDDTFQYNRFGTKNGYIFMILRVYFDIGFYGMGQLAEPKGDKSSASNVNNACNTM